MSSTQTDLRLPKDFVWGYATARSVLARNDDLQLQLTFSIATRLKVPRKKMVAGRASGTNSVAFLAKSLMAPMATSHATLITATKKTSLC
jgi:hypothetical protein